jgi:hypothetical protein
LSKEASRAWWTLASGDHAEALATVAEVADAWSDMDRLGQRIVHGIRRP